MLLTFSNVAQLMGWNPALVRPTYFNQNFNGIWSRPPSITVEIFFKLEMEMHFAFKSIKRKSLPFGFEFPSDITISVRTEPVSLHKPKKNRISSNSLLLELNHINLKDFQKLRMLQVEVYFKDIKMCCIVVDVAFSKFTADAFLVRLRTISCVLIPNNAPQIWFPWYARYWGFF